MLISNIILRALKKIVSLLEKQDLDYCLFGGLSMQLYKRIRATKDVDLMVEITSDDIKGFISCMEEDGFRLDRKRGLIKINGLELLRFFYLDQETGFEIFIDIVTATNEFQKQILNHKTNEDFLGIKVNVASLEDLILLKLLADRPIDYVDAQVLLEENKDIDKDYLKNWAKRLKLEKKLESLLKGESYA